MHDEEFAEDSKRFFDRVRRGDCRVLVSQIVFEEIADAPDKVRQVLEDLPDEVLETVPVDEEVRRLADAYVSAGASAGSGRSTPCRWRRQRWRTRT